MIACKVAVERLWGYLDRNLERAQEEELEQHLGLCRHCCGELEFSRQVRSKLAASSESTLSPAGRTRLDEFVRRIDER